LEDSELAEALDPEFRSSASAEQLQRSRKLRGIKPYLLVRRPRVAEALAEAQAEREGGIKFVSGTRLRELPVLSPFRRARLLNASRTE